jgi:hypothetical protein
MIDLMKNLKTDVVETAQAESISSKFEALFMQHWGGFIVSCIDWSVTLPKLKI